MGLRGIGGAEGGIAAQLDDMVEIERGEGEPPPVRKPRVEIGEEFRDGSAP